VEGGHRRLAKQGSGQDHGQDRGPERPAHLLHDPGGAAGVGHLAPRDIAERPAHDGDRDLGQAGPPDVLSVLRRYWDTHQQVGADVAHGLMTELPDVPREVFEVVPGVMTAILDRAVGRGEVRLGRVTPRILALPADLLRHELLVSGGRVPDSVLAEIVDDIFLPLITRPVPGSSPPGG
jgi:hypothetical protein